MALSFYIRALLRTCLFAIALFALALLGACGTSTAAEGEAFDDDGGTSATGGGGGATPTLSFGIEDEPLVLEPSITVELELTVLPVEPQHTVRFALLDGTGPVADAALDLTEAMTDSSGIARVWLTAPSVPTNFKVRALVGTLQKVLTVEVNASGEETLVVEPSYAGGRAVTEWVAEVHADKTCAELNGNPPVGDDAPARSVTVPEGEPIRVRGVPVGTKLAVALRAGYFAGGCSSVESVLEGQPNSVLVTVTNRPIQLDESEVVLRLGLAGQEDALAKGMESVIDTAQAAVLGMAESDSSALLDAMEEEATAGALCNRFGTARSSNAWDDEVAAALGAEAATAIRDELGTWLAEGVPSLARDDAFVATLVAAPGAVDRANLVPTSVAGFAADAAGFPENVEATWTADAHDNVVLGATIVFNPAALLVLAADAPASLAEAGAETLAEALAVRGGRCETVSLALTSRGQGIGQSCTGCDAVCTRLLCERGIERLVNRASSALVDDPAELRVAATGAAEVGEQAELRTLDGSWVGALDAANRSSELSGELAAEGAK